MPAVHVRNVPEPTLARLKERAASRGRSLEAELRSVLDDAASAPLARPRRAIIWPTYESGRTEPYDRDDFYPDDDDRRP
ncbi:FitA-like ribbon-helix-helix domain-containing protein [Salana multivorans]